MNNVGTVLAWVAALLALAVAALWITTRYLVFRAERAYPPLGQTLTVRGQPMHYLAEGSGAPLVLIHGAFGGLQDFTGTIGPTLAKTHRVIAIDRPGHGYSGRDPSRVMTPDRQAEALHGLLQQVQPGPVTLVGFSWGGAVAMAYALAYPEDVRAVVILNGATFPWPTGLSPVYDWATLPVIGPLFRHTVLMPMATFVTGNGVAHAFHPEPVPLTFANSPLALSLRPGSFRANAEDLIHLKAFLREQSQRYGTVRVPLVIVAGSGDQVVSPEIHALALHAAVPGSVLKVLPGAGHQILYSRPGDVLAAIAQVEQMSAHGKR